MSPKRMRFPRHSIIDISGLNGILSIFPGINTASVEPAVTFEQLVRETLNRGMLPAVVPPLPQITVGGAYASAAASGSSYRHGHFNRAVSRIEVVTGNGNVVQASRNDNPDLFYGCAGAMGTLGVVTMLQVHLIKSEEYVRLQYHPIGAAIGVLERVIGLPRETADTQPVDFVDGIMFSEDQGMMVLGKFYFLHVHGKLRCPPNKRCVACGWTIGSAQYNQNDDCLLEEVHVIDYLFRYNRGCFWMAIYGLPPFLKLPLRRHYTPEVMPASFWARAHQLHHPNTKYLLQTVEVPHETFVVFMKMLHDRPKIYPLWICPVKVFADIPRQNYSLLPRRSGYGFEVIIGI
ncbi:FAD-binding domain-containing protein [Sporormia fimetaria CBS 119925]|uniref:Delta(24)-sterol reductase n=1 Tax=Sporormia fimetaria CBS 119925 TaxID=1340428 RepID=A0A6A6VPM0_9PLEO|nr:FAD-binding domain-containing protein [Sporormia fimetaria CBS 119925]